VGKENISRKDSKPKKFPLQTMKKLPQFRNKSHEEVRRYILQTKGRTLEATLIL
jgi:hypothetical protein